VTTDQAAALDRALTDAYRCCCEASVDHDIEHYRRACAEVTRLEQLLPAQRHAEKIQDP
jgi:hypothetical protein